MKEIWKPVVGYENLYEVSNLGRVKSLARRIHCNRPSRPMPNGIFINEKILTPKKTIWGYLSVALCDCGTIKHTSIHRIVANAFIPNPDGKPHVNHKNETKTDNRVENLEWATAKENMHHNNLMQRVLEKTIKTNKEKHGKKIYCEEQRKLYNSIHEFCEQNNMERREIQRKIKRVGKIEDGIIILKKTRGFKTKKIICVETGEIFESLTEAVIKTHKTKGTIHKALKYANRTAGGLHWKYV